MQKRFYERQYFWEQPIAWIVWLIYGTMLAVLWYLDLLEDISSTIFIISGFLAVVIMASSMTTEISETQISVQMRPFHFKPRVFSWDLIETAEIRKYSPMGEYGGWGIRFGRHGKAYNVSGNMGLQLTFSDGKKLLLGTKKPDELEQVLSTIGRKS